MTFSRFLSLTVAVVTVGAITVFSGAKNANERSVASIQHVSKAGGSNDDSATSVDKSSAKTAVLSDRQILFFMNPNGHPCQMQLSILEDMKDKLSGRATIKYVKTTESGDQDLFYTYGIRGLPSLIILDKNGKEIKRFTPGIQDEKTILSALGGSDK